MKEKSGEMQGLEGNAPLTFTTYQAKVFKRNKNQSSEQSWFDDS